MSYKLHGPILIAVSTEPGNVFEHSSSFHVASSAQLVKVNNPATDRCHVPEGEYIHTIDAVKPLLFSSWCDADYPSSDGPMQAILQRYSKIFNIKAKTVVHKKTDLKLSMEG